MSKIEQLVSQIPIPSDPIRTAEVRERLFGSPRRFAPERYELFEEIGRGHFGRVYRAHDGKFDRVVAIKSLPFRDDLEKKRIRREAHALACVSHPNVVQVYDQGVAARGRYYIALEYVPGHRLDHWLRAQSHTLEEILRVFVQAGEGLQAIHDQGLVHRDFKPANVVVGQDGRARVLDFGLARRSVAARARDRPVSIVDSNTTIRQGSTPTAEANDVELRGQDATGSRPDGFRGSSDDWEGAPDSGLGSAGESSNGRSAALDASLTGSRGFAGTAVYAAPEQLVGTHAGPRSDQFSFCVALFEAVHGVRPFEGTTIVELTARIAVGEISDETPARAVPRWLADLLRRGLSPDPAERFADLDAVISVLRERLQPRHHRWRWLATGGLLSTAMTSAVLMGQPDPVVPVHWDDGWHGARVQLEQRHGPQLLSRLDEYEADWGDAHQAIESMSFTDAQVACLERGQHQFGVLVDFLVDTPRATKGLADPSALRAERLWVADLFDPTRCINEASAAVDGESVVEELLESERLQFEGRWEDALANLDSAIAGIQPLGRIWGLAMLRRGLLQARLQESEALDTFGLAVLGSQSDPSLLADILLQRLWQGMWFRADPKRLEQDERQLELVLEQLRASGLGPDTEQELVLKLARAYRALDEDPVLAERLYSEVRDHYVQTLGPGPLDRRAVFAELNVAFAVGFQPGRQVEAATLLQKLYPRLVATLGPDHRALPRWTVNLATHVISAWFISGDQAFERSARKLLQRAADFRDGGDHDVAFEVLRADAELLYLDTLQAAELDEFMDRAKEWGERADVLMSRVGEHVGRPRRSDLAQIAGRIVTAYLSDLCSDRLEKAIDLWLRYEDHPEQLETAFGYLEQLEAQKTDCIAKD